MAVYTALPSLQDTVKYLIPNLFTVLFSVAYLFNYKFSAKVVERILMLAQDIVIIATLNLFVFKYDLIVEKDIDFYAIAVVLIIEILETLIKFIMFCKNNGDGDMDASVAPEKEGRENNKRPSNSFGDSFNEMNPEIAQNSRNDLRNSQVYNQSPSPKRGRAPRR